jgi:hypothetical protein
MVRRAKDESKIFIAGHGTRGPPGRPDPSLEWGSSIAVENSTVGARPPENMPAPRWWWLVDATPDARVSARANLDEQDDETPVELPAEGDTVSFGQHIKPLFRARNR